MYIIILPLIRSRISRACHRDTRHVSGICINNRCVTHRHLILLTLFLCVTSEDKLISEMLVFIFLRCIIAGWIWRFIVSYWYFFCVIRKASYYLKVWYLYLWDVRIKKCTIAGLPFETAIQTTRWVSFQIPSKPQYQIIGAV